MAMSSVVKKPTKRQAELLEFIREFQQQKSYSPSLEEMAEHFDISIPTIHQHIQALKKKGLITARKGEKRAVELLSTRNANLVLIPLLGIIPAGGPIEPIENREPIEVPKSMLSRSGNHYALQVKGRSMIEEGISDGDIVVIREQQTVNDGESAVAYLPEKNEVTLKRIYREENRVRLQPANNIMSPFYETNVEIQGKVIGVLRKYEKIKWPNLFEIKKDTSVWSLSDSLLPPVRIPPPQLLKWIGNKQRFASSIANIFPQEYNRYFEPFLGSGAVLGAMAPREGIVGDILKPLIDLWKLLQDEPEKLYQYYKKSWDDYFENPKETYQRILSSYNANPNSLDFLFISRSCYGGVIRFTKAGTMSTPMGPHKPISPDTLKERMILWRNRIKNTEFVSTSFETTMSQAGAGDIIYCDPPYVDSQAILYGAQAFSIHKLWEEIARAKSKGAKIALSIDGQKKSGLKTINLSFPYGLFERQLFVNNGSSMLKRFQKKDQTMIGEDVHDRLLLTW